jgi:hypothetical protein
VTGLCNAGNGIVAILCQRIWQALLRVGGTKAH